MYISYSERHRLQELAKPTDVLSLVVTIPCYREEDVCRSVQSVLDCDLENKAQVEIIILINSSDSDDESTLALNRKSYEKLCALNHHSNMSIIPIVIYDIPAKIAGVGMARKIAMDLASDRLNEVGESDQIIAAFDADSICSKNYLIELIEAFKGDPKLGAVSICFEHVLDGLIESSKKAIISYELHLRYFINMQRLCSLPFAFQTVGSSMAVRNEYYRKLGGMNKRKAGEDFYFLQKYIKNNLCRDLQTCTVFPSARQSDRVPFGTGRAMNELLESQLPYMTYHFESFKTIENLNNRVDDFWHAKSMIKIDEISKEINPIFHAYLEKENGVEKIWSIKNNVKNVENFPNRFYQYFDAFQLMKYVHFVRDNYYCNIPIENGIEYLFKRLNLAYQDDSEVNLSTLRDYDRNIKYLYE